MDFSTARGVSTLNRHIQGSTVMCMFHNSCQTTPCLSGCHLLPRLLTDLPIPSLLSISLQPDLLRKIRSLHNATLKLFIFSHKTFGSYFKLHVWPVRSLVMSLHLTSSCTIAQASILLFNKAGSHIRVFALLMTNKVVS